MMKQSKEKKYEDLTFADDFMFCKVLEFYYLCKGKVQSEFVRRIESKVDKARKHEEWRLEYMTLFMRDMEKKEEGMLEKGMICYLNALSMKLSRESAMRIVAITEEEALLAEELRSKGEI